MVHLDLGLYRVRVAYSRRLTSQRVTDADSTFSHASTSFSLLRVREIRNFQSNPGSWPEQRQGISGVCVTVSRLAFSQISSPVRMYPKKTTLCIFPNFSHASLWELSIVSKHECLTHVVHIIPDTIPMWWTSFLHNCITSAISLRRHIHGYVCT